MKSFFISIGSFSTAAVNVFQMENFNPFTLVFWSTLTGIFFWSVVGGLIGLIIFEGLKSKLKWHGIGQIHSKDL